MLFRCYRSIDTNDLHRRHWQTVENIFHKALNLVLNFHTNEMKEKKNVETFEFECDAKHRITFSLYIEKIC